MKMKSASVIGFLGLLILVEPLGATENELKVYELDISVHEGVEPVNPDKINQVLETASHMLEHCGVKFKRGSIGSFGSPTPKKVKDAESLEAVHSVTGDVKIVESLTFCRPGNNNDHSAINGCAWRDNGLPRTVILRRGAIDMAALWAHEFGHTKGLPHRNDTSALMFCRPGHLSGRKVTEDECKCLREGCAIPDPEPNIQCQ
jgi:matrixin